MPISNVSSATDVNTDSNLQHSYNSLLRVSQSLLSRNNPHEGVSCHLYIAGGASFIFNILNPKKKGVLL